MVRMMVAVLGINVFGLESGYVTTKAACMAVARARVTAREGGCMSPQL